jgi:hypothetical protein
MRSAAPDTVPGTSGGEAAWTDMLPDASRHAYGYFHKTLCGIEKPDMTGSQFGMWGGAYSDECPDGRGPRHRRAVARGAT